MSVLERALRRLDWKDPRKMAGFGLISDGVPIAIVPHEDTHKPTEPPRGSTPVDCDTTRRMRKAKV